MCSFNLWSPSPPYLWGFKQSASAPIHLAFKSFKQAVNAALRELLQAIEKVW